MKCKEIQDLMITDYLDDRLTSQQKTLIEAHLKECVACREFLAVVKKTVVAPFERSESHVPPESIWQRIQKALSVTF